MQSRLAGRIMFSTCPFVRPSVRLSVCLFVRLLPTCERYTSKVTEPISMQIVTNLPWGKDMNGQGHRRPKLCLEAWRIPHSRPVSRVDRGSLEPASQFP